jgi:signal transduction histidine kinase
MDLFSGAIELVSATDPREIMSRLVRLAVDKQYADRCTLTSFDQNIFRVEESYEASGRPTFVGNEYPLSFLDGQPLLQKAVATGRIVTGGSLTDRAQIDPSLTSALQGVRRTAVVPLQLTVSVGALLILSRKEDRPFDGAELEQLQQIGAIAVLVLRNARLLEDVNAAQQRGLEALTLISRHVASSEELPVFFGKMSRSVASLVRAEKAAFWMIEDKQLVAQREAHGFSPDRLSLMTLPLPPMQGEDMARLVFGGAALGVGAGDATSGGNGSDLVSIMNVRDVLAVPWRTAEMPLGILVACDSAAGFADQDEWIMRLAARASALVWQGYRAEQRANELQAQERQRLQDHAARVAEIDRQKSEFLRLASHELRSPVTAVGGYLSMLEDGSLGELPGTVQKVIPKMASRVEKMKLLVDQMLSAARTEDSRFAVSPTNMSMGEAIGKAVAALSERKPASRVTVDAADGATAFADPEKVETIVTNLLSNAIKYSPSGGDVTLRLRTNADHVELDVVDAGIGINADDISKLFQPFGRLDHPEVSAIEGTGLGLYLSRELARIQGGDISVRSQPDRGSIFTLRLPRATEP